MVVSELAPYTPEESYRDSVEAQLAVEANRREINERHSNGIRVVAYWLMKENICLIFVHDERANQASEFVVPNDEVAEWFIHPFAHRDNTIPRYEQRSNDND